MSATYILDFDSTLISSESLDELARIGMGTASDKEQRLAQFAEITNQGMEGTLSFDESLRQRVSVLKAKRDHVAQLIEELKESITDSALENKDWFVENADNIYIVSGGFEDYIIPIAEELGIPASNVFANRFVYDENDAIVDFDTTSHLSKAGGKVAQVADLDLSGTVVMIGDGMTDYEVRAKGQADEFWAFTQHVARPMVIERADRVLTSFEDITAAV